MKICLIDPPGVTKGLNVGLGYIASSLINQNHQVKVIDLNDNTKDFRNRLDSIKSYDLIGISIKSSVAQSAREISDILGRKDLICGGVHIAVDGYNFLNDNPNFSIGVIGEGEETLIKIANVMENGLALRDIKGIVYRDGGEIKTSPESGSIADLDSLPYPSYEFFDSFNGTIAEYPLVTSRGCPYSCVYCCVRLISGKKWRFRTPESVIRELEFAKSKYKSMRFEISDDNFTQNIDRVKEICKLLLKHEIGMSWSCPNGIRAKGLDEESVALMKESGCDSVSIGIESLDEAVFDNIKKGEKVDDIRQAISILHSHKIKVSGFFIVGLPGDNLQKIKSSVELSKKLPLEGAIWNLFVPYPGTRAWSWVNSEAKIIRDWEEGFHFGGKLASVFETDGFSEKERIRAFELANIKCRAYLAFFDKNKSLLANAFHILRLIFKYDPQNIFPHIFYGLRQYRGRSSGDG